VDGVRHTAPFAKGNGYWLAAGQAESKDKQKNWYGGDRYALAATFQRWPSGSLKYPEYPPH
jgi:hypothetical protein